MTSEVPWGRLVDIMRAKIAELEAALADPLVLLEMLAKKRKWASTTDINVIWRGDHFDYEAPFVGVWKDITRAEAAALLEVK